MHQRLSLNRRESRDASLHVGAVGPLLTHVRPEVAAEDVVFKFRFRLRARLAQAVHAQHALAFVRDATVSLALADLFPALAARMRLARHWRGDVEELDGIDVVARVAEIHLAIAAHDEITSLLGAVDPVGPAAAAPDRC